jgi:hypothetical protein
LPWAQVSETSAALKHEAHTAAAAAAAAAAATDGETPCASTASSSSSSSGWPCSVECCDLLPNQSYVDFRVACDMVDLFAVNYTAQVLGQPMP